MIKTSDVEYEIGGKSFTGYFADGSNGRRVPGIVVAHEGPGLTAHPKERARMRVMYNIADQYILTPLFELFEQIDPKVRNAKVVDQQLTELSKGLKGLEHFIAPGKYAMGATASLADCALIPSLFFVGGIGPMLGQGDLMAATPKVKAYWAAVQADPSVAKVVQEMSTALAAYLSANR